MEISIYHKQLGFPSTLLIPQERIFNLEYTQHANERKYREDKYNLLIIPTTVKVTAQNIEEVYTFNDRHIRKVRIRIPYDGKRDIVLVLELLFKQAIAKVVTFWLNYKDYRPQPNPLKYKQP